MNEHPTDSAYPQIPHPSPEVEALGSRLYYELERLDPSYESRKWDDLGDAEKDVYLFAIEAVILLEPNAVRQVLSGRGPPHAD